MNDLNEGVRLVVYVVVSAYRIWSVFFKRVIFLSDMRTNKYALLSVLWICRRSKSDKHGLFYGLVLINFSLHGQSNLIGPPAPKWIWKRLKWFYDRHILLNIETKCLEFSFNAIMEISIKTIEHNSMSNCILSYWNCLWNSYEIISIYSITDVNWISKKINIFLV